MNFTSLSNGTSCNCLDGATQDSINAFSRRIGTTSDLKDRDFKSYHEKNKIPNTNDCDEICGYRGVSLDIWNEASRDAIKAKYFRTLEIAPKYRNQISVLRLKEGSGMVKHTPNQKDGHNPFHYDFYKCDEFVIDSIELLELIPIKQ